MRKNNKCIPNSNKNNTNNGNRNSNINIYILHRVEIHYIIREIGCIQIIDVMKN